MALCSPPVVLADDLTGVMYSMIWLDGSKQSISLHLSTHSFASFTPWIHQLSSSPTSNAIFWPLFLILITLGLLIFLRVFCDFCHEVAHKVIVQFLCHFLIFPYYKFFQVSVKNPQLHLKSLNLYLHVAILSYSFLPAPQNKILVLLWQRAPNLCACCCFWQHCKPHFLGFNVCFLFLSAKQLTSLSISPQWHHP